MLFQQELMYLYHVPFILDQLVDGPQYAVPPPPWDVVVEVPPMYTDSCQKVRVPHTSFVKVKPIAHWSNIFGPLYHKLLY